MALTDEIDTRIEALLLEWWPWERSYRAGPMQVHAASIYQRARSRSGYDSAADLLAESVDHVLLEAVGAAVGSLCTDHRHAIEIMMLRAYSGAAVWRSNRLGEAVEQVYADAKEALLPLLRRRHVEI